MPKILRKIQVYPNEFGSYEYLYDDMRIHIMNLNLPSNNTVIEINVIDLDDTGPDPPIERPWGPLVKTETMCSCGHEQKTHSEVGCHFVVDPMKSYGDGRFCKCQLPKIIPKPETFPDRDLPADSLDPVRKAAFKDMV